MGLLELAGKLGLKSWRCSPSIPARLQVRVHAFLTGLICSPTSLPKTNALAGSGTPLGSVLRMSRNDFNCLDMGIMRAKAVLVMSCEKQAHYLPSGPDPTSMPVTHLAYSLSPTSLRSAPSGATQGWQADVPPCPDRVVVGVAARP